MLPNDPYCISEVTVCPGRMCSWRWAGKQPQENAPHHVAHWHTITRLWIWSMTQSMVITALRNAKRQMKMLNLLVLKCGNLPNEWNWLHKMSRLSFSFKSGLQAYHNPSAGSSNGFKVRHTECHMASILQKQVKINRGVCQHKGFANRE